LAVDEKIQLINFEKLFHEHFRALCYFAKKYVGDLDISKEIVHNVFIRLWENRSAFDWQKPAKSYLFTAVYNRSMNYLRDNKKNVSDKDGADIQNKADESVFSDTMEVAELESRIKSALQRLPEKCREVFELNRFDGKKYTEIAAYLNISVKTVESQMSKALKLLKEELKDYLYVFLLFVLKNMSQ
jgi:RNA polymerase sigma-70 factor (ECF subfamily)